MRLVAGLVVALLAAGGCGRPSEPDCDRLLDHFLDVEATSATAGRFKAMPAPVQQALTAEKQRSRDALAPDFLPRCRDELSRGEVACAIAATDQAGMDRCEGR